MSVNGAGKIAGRGISSGRLDSVCQVWRTWTSRCVGEESRRDALCFAVSLHFCFSFLATSCMAYSSQRADMSHAWSFALSLRGQKPLARSTCWAGVISTVGGCDFHRGRV